MAEDWFESNSPKKTPAKAPPADTAGDWFDSNAPKTAAAAVATQHRSQTPAGFLSRAWTAINTPIGTHFKSYNDETEKLNRVQDFAQTAEGRAAYEKHPTLTAMRSIAAGMERDLANLLTPAMVATSVAPAATAFTRGAVPASVRIVNVAGGAAKAATAGAFGAVGAGQVLHAVTDHDGNTQDRWMEGLGGAAALMGTAAEAGQTAGKHVQPDFLRRTLQDTFGAGEDFQQKLAEPYGKEAEKTRQTNDKREELNAGRLKQYAERVKATVLENERTVRKYGKRAGVHMAAVDQNAADHAKAVQVHADAVQHAADTERVRQQTMDEHEQLSQQQTQAVEAAKTQAKTDNDAKWEGVREGIGDRKQDVTPILHWAEIAQKHADPTTSPLIGAITRKANEVGNGGPVNIWADGREFTPGEQAYGRLYELQFGTPPPLNQEPEAPGATFDTLHRWYSFISNSMYSGQGRMEQGAYNLHHTLRASIGDAMESLARDSGQLDQLREARENHRHMMETFHDSPNQPASNASVSLKETTGGYVNEQARKGRLDLLGYYDPEIPQRAERIRSLQTTLEGLPSQATTGTANKPAPEPSPEPAKPEMGELKNLPAKPRLTRPMPEPVVPDISSEMREQLQTNIKKYGRLGSWVARLIIGGTTAYLSHGNIGALASDLAIGQVGVSMLSKALQSESVLNWMSKPTAETLHAIDSVPPQDAAKLREALTGMAIEDIRRGDIAPVDGRMAAFLGPNNMTAITTAIAASRPATAAEAKRRVAALQGAMDDPFAAADAGGMPQDVPEAPDDEQ